MGIGTWVALIVGAFVLCILGAARFARQREQAILAAMAATPGFKASKSIAGMDQASCIGVDDVSQTLCLVSAADGRFSTRLVPYSDLVSAELFEDGMSVMMAARTRFPRPGEKGGWADTAAKSIRMIELRLVVNRPAAPQHHLVFLNIQTAKNSQRFAERSASARVWFAIMSDILDRSHRQDEEPAAPRRPPAGAPAVAPAPPGSVADEIRKLGELMRSGLLTEEEFAEQKANLLGDSDYEARATARRLSFGSKGKRS